MIAKNTQISDFLEKVKNKFPEWLKVKTYRLNEILQDLEQQILDKAREISGGVEPNQEEINQAILLMGSPEDIAKIYKKRGTPKFYITEELWDLYLRGVIFSLAIVVVINFLIVIFQIFFVPWYQLFGDFISGVYIGFLIAIIIVTGLFVFVSMEGYLPEDFGELPRYLGIVLEKDTRKEIRTSEYEIEVQKAKTQEKLEEAKVQVKSAIQEVKEDIKKSKRKFRTVSNGDLIGGAIVGIVFGLICIIQPFYSLHVYFELEFLEWLRFLGLIVFIGGLIDLIRLAIGANNISGQKVMLIITAIFTIAYFPLVIYLLTLPEIFPINLLSGFQISQITPGITLDIYLWVGLVILVGIVISIFVNIYKAARLGEPVE